MSVPARFVSASSSTKSSTVGNTFTIGGAGSVGDVELILVAIPSATVSVSNIADTSSGPANVYSRLNSATNGALTVELWTVTLVNSVGTVTVTLSAAGTLAAVSFAAYRNFTGLGAATVVTGSTSPASTGATTLAQPLNSILVCGIGIASASTFTATNGTARNQTSTTGIASVVMDSLQQQVTATDSATLSVPAVWVAIYVEVDGIALTPSAGPIVRNWKQEVDSGNATSVTTLSITATGAQSVTVGDLIVAIWRTTQKGGTISISDNKNAGQYQTAYLNDEIGAGNTGELACYYMPNSVAVAVGQLTVTITTSISALCYLAVLVYHGADLVSPFDGANFTSYAPATNQFPSSGFVTPTRRGDLAVGSVTMPSTSLNFVAAEAVGFTRQLNDDFGASQFAHCHSGDVILGDLTALEYAVAFEAGSGPFTPIIGMALFRAPQTGDSFSLSGKYQLS